MQIERDKTVLRRRMKLFEAPALSGRCFYALCTFSSYLLTYIPSDICVVWEWRPQTGACRELSGPEDGVKVLDFARPDATTWLLVIVASAAE